ncbi:MAG: DUF4440 domain-containing protein [Methanomassiliicoccales archaeon]
MIIQSSIVDYFRLLEEYLLQPITNISELDKIIADDFVEYGVSGAIYNKKQVIEVISATPNINVSLTNFQLKCLSPDIYLVTYQARKTVDSKNTNSLRCSVWRRHQDVWQIVFHQGTPLPDLISP